LRGVPCQDVVLLDPAGSRVVDIDVGMGASAARGVFVHQCAAEATLDDATISWIEYGVC
jgi:hypothetical protein